MTYIPDQGDIIWLEFDPSTGNEIMKRRPALVLSKRIFNDHAQMAIVAPITSNVRGVKLEVVLPDNLSTVGAALIYQLKAVDFSARNCEFIETVPDAIIKSASEIAQVLLKK